VSHCRTVAEGGLMATTINFVVLFFKSIFIIFTIAKFLAILYLCALKLLFPKNTKIIEKYKKYKNKYNMLAI